MKRLSILLAASALAATAAQAQGQAQAVQQACSGEVQSLCPGKTGQDAVSCLKAAGNSKLSANCQTALQSAEQAHPRKRGGSGS